MEQNERFISFIIEGEPRTKQRPRFSNYGSVYTPRETAEYEGKVKYSYLKLYKNVPKSKENLKIEIIANFAIPNNKSKEEKKLMLVGNIRPTKKDADNIAKIILDGLNNVAYEDDGQVVELIVIKKYNKEAYVEVKIEPLEHKKINEDNGIQQLKII